MAWQFGGFITLFTLTAVQSQSISDRPVWKNTAAIQSGRQLSEDLSPGSSIGFVYAEDPYLNRSVTYSLSGKAAQYLEINAITGEIKIKTRFDFEREFEVSIVVTARDQDGDTQSFTSALSILDANDNLPTFSQTVYNFDIYENQTVGFNITFLSVTDVDTNNNLIRVSCDNRTAAAARACQVFGLQQVRISNKFWEGWLFLQLPLDYEKEKSYSVRLRALDGLNIQLQEIQIGVLDVNDAPPFFVRAQGSVIYENQPNGTYIDFVSAQDADEATPRPIRYELYGDGEALRYFSLDSVSGSITNAVVLDYEDPDREPGKEFTLQIRARELISSNPKVLGNDSMTTATALVTVRLIDINDNCPTFDKADYNVSVREDIAQGTNIPLQMTVTDKDSGSLSTFDLSLVYPSTTFAVTPSSGRSPASVTINVISAAGIDYETGTLTYNLQVMAKENYALIQNPCNGTAMVHIQIEDVNDNPPQFKRDQYRANVSEDALGGTIVITVTASDIETGIFGKAGIRYNLIGSGQNLFQIDELTGVVSVATCSGTRGLAPCLDYEQKQRYDLAVTAEDNAKNPGFLSRTVPLIIDVLNVNDNSPRFIESYFRYIQEGQILTTDPLKIQAFDLDGDAITYSIPDNQRDATYWTVDNVTGNVTAKQPIAYSDVSDQTTGLFQFDALASDGIYTVPARVTIQVIDINDKDPIFLPTIYRISISESTQGGKSILQISVTDADSPTTGNGVVDVSIDDGSFGKFVTQTNGTLPGNVILTNIVTSPDATFDYDLQSFYTLIVKGRDRGSPSRTGSATVYVSIIDSNNKNPYFDPPTLSVTVSENAPVDYTVTQVQAFDNDADAKLVVTFIEPIRAYNPSGVEVDRKYAYNFTNLFRIDPITRYVQVNSQLNRDFVNFISFTLHVTDTTPSTLQTGLGTLFIRILEYNDQAPYFELPFYNLSILEERPLASFVGSLLAMDVDDSIAMYQLASNPGNLFTISSTSGVLRVNGRLDYETQHNVTLIAQAFDSGSPQLQNTTTVLINIININDNTPVFSQMVYQVFIKENSHQIIPALIVSARDADQGDYGVVRYMLNENKYFTVDNITGQIFIKQSANLDREMLATYTFQVTAYDSPLDPNVRLFTSVPIYITLLDINDNCPVFSQPDGYEGIVIETADIGDQVVELSASDLDTGINANIRFSINNSSDGASLFSINSWSGRIEVSTSLRGKSGTYILNVTASDRGGESSPEDAMCSTSVRVRIIVNKAVNDAPIWILPPSKNFIINVLESQYEGMLVYDCKALDYDTGDAGIVDYYFNIQQKLSSSTPEFRINQVTCVIRAQIVFDRETVSSYVLTIVAKDHGDPPASSETVLIVNVLDVNDNEPEFPMRDGLTIPYKFYLPEGSVPRNKVIGVVNATDKDSNTTNNKILYKIVAGNDNGLFSLNPTTGELRLTNDSTMLDREKQALYSMEVLAYNFVNDDSVIRNRRRRSTNPSIVTVTVEVSDINDTPPRFLSDNYYGCVPSDAAFGQSILQVEAIDPDVEGTNGIVYSIESSSTSAYFMIDSSTGIISNNKLLSDIGSTVQTIKVLATDSSTLSSSNMNSTSVKILVSSKSNEVVIQISQPSADVRVYKDQLMRVIQNSSLNSNPPKHISFVCISEIRDHVNDDGTLSYSSTDVVASAVAVDNLNNYGFLAASDLQTAVNQQLNTNVKTSAYSSLSVNSVKVQTEVDAFSFSEDGVIGIFIICILLLFLAIILVIVACCLIRNSKEKQIKKLRTERHTGMVLTVQQPVHVAPNPYLGYDVKGYPPHEEYAVVVKKPIDSVHPANLPATHVTPVHAPDHHEPLTYVIPDFTPTHLEPDLDSDDEPEPVIVTEPVDLQQSPPPVVFDYEPEPMIVTEVVPDVEPHRVSTNYSDMDFDSSPENSPRQSRSSSVSSNSDFRIETNVM